MTREPGRAPPRHAHGDLTSLAPHERLPEFDGCNDGEVFTAAGKVAVIYAIGTPRLVFDYDRDGYISDADIAKAKAGKTTFRFWMNDDGDSGDVCSNADFNSDRPSHGYNYQDDKVNGRRDLLDFTPVWIDFSEVYPPNTPDEIKNKITWKLRSSCVNVVWTSFSRSDAGDFLWYDKQGCGKGLGQYAHEAETVAIDGGKEFPYSFKEAMKNSPDKGVFLIEGRGGRDGLEIVGTGRFDNEIIRGEANLSISSVERMYRWFCHRTYAGGARGLNDQAGSPRMTNLTKPQNHLRDFNISEPPDPIPGVYSIDKGQGLGTFL